MTNLQPLELETYTQLLSTDSRLGALHLAVTDAAVARGFWVGVLGLTELKAANNTIRLGTGQQELVILHPNATSKVEPRRTGLYHVAIHLPTRKEFARVVARLFDLKYPNSPTDHTFTETTYLSDPDGNGIELTLETPERGRAFRLPNGQLAIQTSDGRFVGPVERLDLKAVFAALEPNDDLYQPMPAGTKIGHVHLHVRDIQAAANFYQSLLGFRLLMDIREMGMMDFGLEETSIPHTLAINAWNGTSAAKPTPGTAGLRHFTIHIPSSDLEPLKARLQAANWTFQTLKNGIEVLDPSDNSLQVIV